MLDAFVPEPYRRIAKAARVLIPLRFWSGCRDPSRTVYATQSWRPAALRRPKLSDPIPENL